MGSDNQGVIAQLLERLSGRIQGDGVAIINAVHDDLDDPGGRVKLAQPGAGQMGGDPNRDAVGRGVQVRSQHQAAVGFADHLVLRAGGRTIVICAVAQVNRVEGMRGDAQAVDIRADGRQTAQRHRAAPGRRVDIELHIPGRRTAPRRGDGHRGGEMNRLAVDRRRVVRSHRQGGRSHHDRRSGVRAVIRAIQIGVAGVAGRQCVGSHREVAARTGTGGRQAGAEGRPARGNGDIVGHGGRPRAVNGDGIVDCDRLAHFWRRRAEAGDCQGRIGFRDHRPAEGCRRAGQVVGIGGIIGGGQVGAGRRGGRERARAQTGAVQGARAGVGAVADRHRAGRHAAARRVRRHREIDRHWLPDHCRRGAFTGDGGGRAGAGNRHGFTGRGSGVEVIVAQELDGDRVCSRAHDLRRGAGGCGGETGAGGEGQLAAQSHRVHVELHISGRGSLAHPAGRRGHDHRIGHALAGYRAGYARGDRKGRVILEDGLIIDGGKAARQKIRAGRRVRGGQFMDLRPPQRVIDDNLRLPVRIQGRNLGIVGLAVQIQQHRANRYFIAEDIGRNCDGDDDVIAVVERGIVGRDGRDGAGRVDHLGDRAGGAGDEIAGADVSCVD